MEYHNHEQQGRSGRTHNSSWDSMDNRSSSTKYAPPYVMLSDAAGSSSSNLRPPPNRRHIPRYPSTAPHGLDSHERRKISCNMCCKCICCSCAFIFILLLLLLTAGIYLYIMYQPKIPQYSINDMRVTTFDLRPDLSLYTEITIVVRAENPNERVGIIYGKEGAVAITYRGSTLSYGHLPVFRQGYRNTTVIKVVMRGRSEFGSGLQEALMENRRSGRVPVDVFVRVPVSLLLGSLQTSQIRVVVHCALVLDSLSPTRKPNILSTNYDVKVKP